MRIGPSTVSGDLDRYELHIEVDGLVADLSIERGAPSWRPGAGITFFDAAESTTSRGWCRCPTAR